MADPGHAERPDENGDRGSGDAGRTDRYVRAAGASSTPGHARDAAAEADDGDDAPSRKASPGTAASQSLRANVELKARLDDPAAAIAVCERLLAEDRGQEDQADTYFSLGKYRLKLRESSRGTHWLIGYARPDEPGARVSQYRLTPVPNPGALKAVLTRQWGVKAVVRKRRRLFLWKGRVRIHVDDVFGLGSFLEFEAVLDPADPSYDEAAAHLDLVRLRHDFGVENRDLVSDSYSTLLLQSLNAPAGT